AGGGCGKSYRFWEYLVLGRSVLGITVANLVAERGDLVGALITDADDEVLVVMQKGKIVRTAVSEVNLTGRTTQGVTFAKPDKGDRIIAITRNVETAVETEVDAADQAAQEEADASGATQEESAGEDVP